MGLSSSCSGLTAENEHLTTAPVIEKMTSSTCRPSPHTHARTHTQTHTPMHAPSGQIIMMICHLWIRSASPRCHSHQQPGGASEYTGRSRDVEVTSIKMRVLASSNAWYGVSAGRQGLDATEASRCVEAGCTVMIQMKRRWKFFFFPPFFFNPPSWQ